MDKKVALVLTLASFCLAFQIFQISTGSELATRHIRSAKFALLTKNYDLTSTIWSAKKTTDKVKNMPLKDDKTNKQIIFITPTRQRPERMADLTMLSQTLSHLKNIHWVLIEDGTSTSLIVEKLLNRSGIPYTCLHTTNNGLPCRGWAHRNLALKYLRKRRNEFGKNAVIYFADDDNGYDVRLFDDFVRNVKNVGIWAVGLPGFGKHGPVEAPKVENGKVVGWLTAWRPTRKFATDMAGFAINLDLVLKSNATFDLRCAGTMPEDCFLSQLGISLNDLEPFGHTDSEILVWHRKTADSNFIDYSTFGYNVEARLPKSVFCDRFFNIHDMSYTDAVKIAKGLEV